jgi:hypothetical protein
MSTSTTARNSELGTSDFRSPTLEREAVPDDLETRNSEVTLRDRIADLGARAKTYWALPAWVSEPPATLTDLTVYARQGAWTTRYRGFIRRLGIGWLYLVAIPQTTLAYLRAHVWQRPGRALAAVLIWTLFIHSVPGIWVAAHIIRPYFHALAWIFLP